MKLIIQMILLFFTASLFAQTADIILENGRAEGGLYKFDISITQTSAWGTNFLSNHLGDGSYRFTRNAAGLDANPVISAIGAKFDNTSYTITAQIISGQINVEVNFIYQGTSSDLVTGAKYLLCAVALTILDANQTSGVGWAPASTAVFDGDDENVASTLIGDLNASPLPVELTSFSASLDPDNSVRLEWETATEVNNYGFEIQKAIDNNPASSNNDYAETSWEKIGFISGSGNSNSAKEYSFTDNAQLSGKIFYRLKQIDADGSFEYSEVIEIEIDLPEKFELFQNYPNPFSKGTGGSQTTAIEFTLPKSGFVKLRVYNILGELVATLLNEQMEAGYKTVRFNAENIPSGIYLYNLFTKDFTQTKKMILIR
ncbi:MAG: T9SS type A sorting domain-containing protein [Chlorobi bacterium]|nr:T9SS type A sorting domain-containing protein [Chlorobiota bacterium]